MDAQYKIIIRGNRYYHRAGATDLIYEVIAGTGTDAEEYIHLSYEDVLNIMIKKLLSDEQLPLTVRRRCCSSVHEQTMSEDTCSKIRKLAGVAEKNGDLAQIRADLDIAVNNWYLRGKISLSKEDLVRPSDGCWID